MMRTALLKHCTLVVTAWLAISSVQLANAESPLQKPKATVTHTPTPTSTTFPKQDLMVEWRQIDENDAAGFSASTQPRTPLLETQEVRVRNGEKARLHLGRVMHMQWVQSVIALPPSTPASGVSTGVGGAVSGGVTNAMTKMEPGQSLSVQPTWPGGKQAVSVKVDMQSANVEVRTNGDLPDQTSNQITTTVNAPLGQWVTLAASGRAAQRGAYSSEVANEGRRLLQIRISAP